MPLYEYKCRHCESEFELLRRFSDSDDDVTCPVCGEREVERLISASSCNTNAAGYGNFSPAACTSFS